MTGAYTEPRQYRERQEEHGADIRCKHFPGEAPEVTQLELCRALRFGGPQLLYFATEVLISYHSNLNVAFQHLRMKTDACTSLRRVYQCTLYTAAALLVLRCCKTLAI